MTGRQVRALLYHFPVGHARLKLIHACICNPLRTVRRFWAHGSVYCAEEDVKLLEVVASYTARDVPVKWSAVANTLVGRTDSNVRRRHGALMKGLEPGALQCAFPTSRLQNRKFIVLLTYGTCAIVICSGCCWKQQICAHFIFRLKAGRKRKNEGSLAPRKLKRPAKRNRAALKGDETSDGEETENESGGRSSFSRESQKDIDVLAPPSRGEPLRSGLRSRASATQMLS